MFSKKSPVITATFCNDMEDIRLAIEVLTGQYVRLIHIDFNTGRAKAYVGDRKENFSFLRDRDDLMSFAFGDLREWYTARFDKPREVMVMKNNDPYKRGEHIMWWTGTSATNRREEPLYPEHVQYCAQKRGLTVQEYLQQLN